MSVFDINFLSHALVSNSNSNYSKTTVQDTVRFVIILFSQK